jgi:hypothetical protein
VGIVTIANATAARNDDASVANDATYDAANATTTNDVGHALTANDATYALVAYDAANGRDAISSNALNDDAIRLKLSIIIIVLSMIIVRKVKNLQR